MYRLWVLYRVILDNDTKTETFLGERNQLKYLIYVENIDVLSRFVLILVWVWLHNFLSIRVRWNIHFGTEMNVKETQC
jgi:hypothetical protein